MTAFLGLTAAYGAFIAGLFIGSTTARRKMIRVTEPIQAVLVMVFFLSIGLLIDLKYIWENLLTVLVLLFIVLIAKSAMNVGILRLVGQPWPRAFLAGVLLSQVGEFSFVIASAGVTMNLVGIEGSRLIISVIALSLIVSPIWLETAKRIQELAKIGISDFDVLVYKIYADEARVFANNSNRAVQVISMILTIILRLAYHLTNRITHFEIKNKGFFKASIITVRKFLQLIKRQLGK